MSETPFQMLPTETRWPGPWHVEEGPDCLCSRCGQPILETDIAVRAWPEDANRFSYRFHPACLGMQSPSPLEGESLEGDPWERYAEALAHMHDVIPDEEMPGTVIWPRDGGTR